MLPSRQRSRTLLRGVSDTELVAQAQIEDLILVTHDGLLKPYDVEILWA
jgi:PIN domain nuclease of toxin-antitoxin system